jgi:hypothetical protein
MRPQPFRDCTDVSDWGTPFLRRVSSLMHDMFRANSPYVVENWEVTIDIYEPNNPGPNDFFLYVCVHWDNGSQYVCYGVCDDYLNYAANLH